METITHTQVQNLVLRLPATKLPLAYDFLIGLADNDGEAKSPQRDFHLLSAAERKQELTLQAEEMVAHYAKTTAEREPWQAGDFVDEG